MSFEKHKLDHDTSLLKTLQDFHHSPKKAPAPSGSLEPEGPGCLPQLSASLEHEVLEGWSWVVFLPQDPSSGTRLGTWQTFSKHSRVNERASVSPSGG